MAASDHLSQQQFFHATPHNLDNETHVLPPSVTGREPNWEGMDPSEAHQVFLSKTLNAAHGWGDEVGGKDYRVYRVQPEGEVDDRPHTTAASRARILQRVHPPE